MKNILNLKQIFSNGNVKELNIRGMTRVCRFIALHVGNMRLPGAAWGARQARGDRHTTLQVPESDTFELWGGVTHAVKADWKWFLAGSKYPVFSWWVFYLHLS